LDEGDCCKDRVSNQPSFEKISFRKFSFVYLYKTYYAKHSTSLCSISIVKTGHLLLPIFESLSKKGENTKKSQKIYLEEEDAGARRKWPKIGWESSKIQRLKFDSIVFTDEGSIDKENSIWERKVQNQMFKDSIKFYWKLNWIYRGFDCKEIDF